MSVDPTTRRFPPESDRDGSTPILPALMAVVLLVSGVLLVSCYDRPEPDTPTDVSPNADLVPQEFNLASLGGIETVFADVAVRVPGFAGFHGADGRLVISLTDPGHTDAARSVVGDVRGGAYREGRRGAVRDLTVRTVEYSFFELAEWRNKARGLFGESFLIGLDLDEELNAVEAIVPNASDEEAARQALMDLEIPEDAIAVSVQVSGTPASGKSNRIVLQNDSSLQDDLRTTGAGQRIVKPNTSRGDEAVCTLGVNGMNDYLDNGVQGEADWFGFLTAAHCTDTIGEVEPDSLWWAQDTSQTADYIAHEAIDDYLYTDTVVPDPEGSGTYDCGDSGKNCRWSDASWQEYDIPRSDWEWRKIWNAGSLSTTIDSNNPDFTITQVSRGSPPAVNDEVTKVGQSTGETTGDVTDTCVDLMSDPKGVFDNPVLIFCSHEVNAIATGGDSGAPVYEMVSGSNENVIYHGLLWKTNSTEDHYYFNHIDEIEREFPPLMIADTVPL